MNWYTVIHGDDNRVSNFFMATKCDLFGHDLYDVKTGMHISNWNREIHLWSPGLEWDGVPDDMLANSLGWPVFSHRLREALAEQGIGNRDIQYLPIRVSRSTGEELVGFSVANVLSRIPALNREHSFLLSVDEDETDPLTGQPNVCGIGKAALESRMLHNHDVIRLLEYFPSVFVSDRFVNVFNKNRFTGATFTRVPVI